MNRLEATYPEIANFISSLDNQQTARLSPIASELAIQLNHVQAAELIQKRDTDGLRKLSEQIEEPYLNSLSNDIDTEVKPELMALFATSRSLDSVIASINGQYEDAIYEALAAGVAPNQIKTLLS